MDDGDGKDQLINAMSVAIGLKQPLPPEFKIKLKKANDFVGQQKYQDALNLLKDLIQICEKYQEFNYIDVFQNKIKELQEKQKEKQLQEEIERKK